MGGCILDCALGRLGLPLWFRKVYLACHKQVWLRFELVSGLGEPCCRDGSIPQGCPLSLVFTVALYVSWCGRRESLPSIKPQLYADNLKCSSVYPNALFGAARFTVQHVRSVGQDVFPAKCVLLSTSKAVRKSMKLWDVSGDGRPRTVELDVRDLGGHLDFTRRARAGTLSHRVKGATGVAAVVALPLGFHVKLGLLRGQYRPAGLHAVEASYVFASALSACRAAISKMLFVHTPVVLDVLDCPVGVDLAFHIIWTMFRFMRRYVAHWPDEVARIFRMPHLIAHGATGHGPVHLLLISAAEIEFAWDGDERGWIQAALLPLRMLSGPIQHFQSAILMPGNSKFVLS